jgi:hypothetical protein
MVRRTDWENQTGRRLRLRDLHIFLTVAQHGSMTKAGQKLRVSLGLPRSGTACH